MAKMTEEREGLLRALCERWIQEAGNMTVHSLTGRQALAKHHERLMNGIEWQITENYNFHPEQMNDMIAEIRAEEDENNDD